MIDFKNLWKPAKQGINLDEMQRQITLLLFLLFHSCLLAEMYLIAGSRQK